MRRSDFANCSQLKAASGRPFLRLASSFRHELQPNVIAADNRPQPATASDRLRSARRPEEAGSFFIRERPMNVLTRRAMLGGAAAIAAANTFPTTEARAAAPMLGKQGPSFYRYKIGDFEVTALSEGSVRNANVKNMAVNKELPDIEKALSAAFLPTDAVTNQFTILVVNTGISTIRPIELALAKRTNTIAAHVYRCARFLERQSAICEQRSSRAKSHSVQRVQQEREPASAS